MGFRYFVSFTTDRSHGNSELVLKRPVRSLADVRLMERLVSEQVDDATVTITNFQPFPTSGTDQS